jgi:hypothetical protein
MPYIANMRRAKDLVNANQLVGNGQCVTFVHTVVTIPPASLWRRGPPVKGQLAIPSGTIIATFDENGHYGNHTNGTSHTAIYLRETPNGIVVLDQWKGQTALRDHPPQQRIIYFRNGYGKKVDDATQYYVVQ